MKKTIKGVLSDLSMAISYDFDVEMPDVMTYRDIATYFEQKKSNWGLLKTTTVGNFLDFLISNQIVRQFNYSFSTKIHGTRFLRRSGAHTTAILSLRPKSFLSHAGAAYVHKLLRSEPFLLVFNMEQIGVESNAMPSQEAIDRAFQNKQRISKARSRVDGLECVMVHSKDVGNINVVEHTCPDPWNQSMIKVRCTSIERTLIDMVVRPAYSGGIDSVLFAWSQVGDLVSIDDLLHVYGEMDFTYPYHQVFGWIMEYTGVFRSDDIKKVQMLSTDRDFYAVHGFKKGVLDYNSKWKLFVPKGMK